MSVTDLRFIDFASPTTLGEANALIARAAADGVPCWPVAGCTDWMVEMHTRSAQSADPKGVAIDITRIPELRGIELRNGVMSIGAAETYLAIRRHALVVDRCELLVRMAQSVGATQIQARGSLGGNLVTGSPAADGVTALFALDAEVTLASGQGTRVVPIRDFYTGYRSSVRRADELVVRVSFVAPAPNAYQSWRKVGSRSAQAISKVALAALAEVDSEGRIARIGFGMASVAPCVLPLHEARDFALNKRRDELDLEALEAVVRAELRPIDDIRSTARYRRHVAGLLVRRFLDSLQSKPQAA